MKKNILKVSLVAAFALFAGYNVYSSQKSDVMSDLALANMEALADPEQPNVDNCTPDPEIDCEALHPTDPSKDVRRQHAKW
ncbi:NVEALA domain-containing protein [Phocaeicola sp.]